MSAYVEWIQESLQALGYEPGPVDGVNGEKTDAAIRLFPDGSAAGSGWAGG